MSDIPEQFHPSPLSAAQVQEEGPSDRWTERVSWGAMLPLAWLIYELTAQPSFALVVACAKFGWNDFLTAHWLLRTDPNQGRGRTCFWFYVASGLWKITVAAFLITGSILILWVAFNGNPPRGLFDAGLTAALGITLLAVIPLVGVMHARVFKVKVWVDSSIHAYRRHDIWPPQATGLNSTMGLLFPALLVPVVVTALITFQLGIWSLLACVFGEGLYIWCLFRGVAAERPADCWGSNATEAPATVNRAERDADED
jgi:hypothetical protein